jgi:hypothetical protein
MSARHTPFRDLTRTPSIFNSFGAIAHCIGMIVAFGTIRLRAKYGSGSEPFLVDGAKFNGSHRDELVGMATVQNRAILAAVIDTITLCRSSTLRFSSGSTPFVSCLRPKRRVGMIAPPDIQP